MAINAMETQISTDAGTIILFVARASDVYKISDIYNPEDPETGKYFPALLSLVVDEEGRLYYVASRDESDYSCVLKPCSFLETGTNSVKVISYGNDTYCLYVDQRTDPHKLAVDAKLLFYGNNIVEYSLYRQNADGVDEVISMYYNAAGQFISDRVPMAAVNPEYPVYKYPTNCHTVTPLTEGEMVTLRARNNLGNVVAEVVLQVRDAAWYNDLSNIHNPIVGIDAEATQMTGDEFYIYEKQDPSHLNIRPYLIYADGTRQEIPIDNRTCFLYGLEYFVPAYPGYSQTLIIKYFLNHRETTTVNTNEVNNVRFITCTKKLRVLDNLTDYSCKVSIIPLYDSRLEKWYLKYFAYLYERDECLDITNYVRYTKNEDTVIEEEVFEFDGTPSKWGTEQKVVIYYNLSDIFHSDADDMQASQVFFITTHDPNDYIGYTFKDNLEANTEVYGDDSTISARPILHYDSSIHMYYIPSTIFTNWDAVLQSFYFNARPPFDSRTETVAPTPTHFVVRDDAGNMIISAPIAVAEYGQAWSPLVQYEDPTTYGSYVGHTVIVEFLMEIAPGEFNILYGVPVKIIESPNQYVAPDADETETTQEP